MENAVFSGENIDSCPGGLIDGNFRNKCVTRASGDPFGSTSYDQEFRIYFPDTLPLTTIFIQGFCAGDGTDFASPIGAKIYLIGSGETVAFDLNNGYNYRESDEFHNDEQTEITSSGYYA